MSEPQSEIKKLSERSRTILRQIVDSYLATGEPVGSRNLARVLPMTLSPASIRNVMSDLEHAGLIYAPHTSAGRLPTQSGLRLFVDGLLEVGDLSAEERRKIEAQIAVKRTKSLDQVLTEAGEMISGLSHCAGVVLAVDLHQSRAEAFQRLHAHRLVVDEGAGLAVGKLHAAQDQRPHDPSFPVFS